MSDLTKFVARMNRVLDNDNIEQTRRVRAELEAMKRLCDRLLERLDEEPSPSEWTLPAIAADITNGYGRLREIRAARENWQQAQGLCD